ncbi:hypothetical protein COL87_01055 [Bacillus pseudomycoides]|nr:hypothetical protein COL87_01055 [Bacillus pseudomycoides]PHE92387.1 hypothetical protein COF78_17500 [Bacillus pseudomycoides]
MEKYQLEYDRLSNQVTENPKNKTTILKRKITVHLKMNQKILMYHLAPRSFKYHHKINKTLLTFR